MSAEFQPADELEQLLIELTEGRLDAIQRARLNELVTQNSDARDYYVKYMTTHALLDWHHGSAPVLEMPLDKTVVVVEPRAKYFSWLPVIATAVLVAIFLGGGLLYLRPRSQEPVATVLDLDGVVWGFHNDELPDDRLAPGQQSISSGVARLQLDSGVVIALQGPVDFVVQTGNRFQLNRGLVRVYCPARAKGFTMMAAGFRILDLGTEFGAAVDVHDDVEVHVFQGTVRIGNSIEMKAGDAGHVNQLNSQVTKPRLKSDVFPSINRQRSAATPPTRPKKK